MPRERLRYNKDRKNLTIRVSKQLFDLVNQRCRERNLSKQCLVTMAILSYVDVRGVCEEDFKNYFENIYRNFF